MFHIEIDLFELLAKILLKVHFNQFKMNFEKILANNSNKSISMWKIASQGAQL